MRTIQKLMVIFLVFFLIEILPLSTHARLLSSCKRNGPLETMDDWNIGGGGSFDLIYLLLISSTTTTFVCMTDNFGSGKRKNQKEYLEEKRKRARERKRQKKNRKKSSDPYWYGSLIDNKNYFTFNLDEIKKEATRGKGENLSLLAHIMGCSKIGETHFSQALQVNYNEVFTSSPDFSAETFVSNMGKIIQNEPILKKECSIGS